MKKETKKFIKNLTLQTPLSEIKEHCKTDNDTLLIMSHLYKFMASEPSTELSEDLFVYLQKRTIYHKQSRVLFL